MSQISNKRVTKLGNNAGFVNLMSAQMEQYYIVMLAFLAVIAVIDLFVGVSNDASNFLNSALGCRIASFRTTMWVASLGVLLGATFSSGMMEVARSGIFHPQMFSFSEIMVVFFAVMVADVILLDAFNSLGLPTSTTVSIVFELLGSAAAAAAWKLLDAGQSLGDLYTYINTSKSLGIVSGILISVVVAFISGAVIQYLARSFSPSASKACTNASAPFTAPFLLLPSSTSWS